MWRVGIECNFKVGDTIKFRELYCGDLGNGVTLLGWMAKTTSGTYSFQNTNDLGLMLEDEFADDKFMIDEMIPCKYFDGDDAVIIIGREVWRDSGKPEEIEDWEGSDQFYSREDAIACLKGCWPNIAKTPEEEAIIKSIYGG